MPIAGTIRVGGNASSCRQAIVIVPRYGDGGGGTTVDAQAGEGPLGQFAQLERCFDSPVGSRPLASAQVNSPWSFYCRGED